MTEKIYYVAGTIICIVVFALGAIWYKGCMVKPCPELKPEIIYSVPESQKALIYAEAFEEGKKSVKPVIRQKFVNGKTVYVIEPDLESQVIANHLYGILDSLILENGKIKDLVMYDLIDSTRYRLELVARWKERSFRGTNLKIFEKPIPEITFWDRWSFGPSIGLHIISISPGDNVRFIGANLGINLTYDLLK